MKYPRLTTPSDTPEQIVEGEVMTNTPAATQAATSAAVPKNQPALLQAGINRYLFNRLSLVQGVLLPRFLSVFIPRTDSSFTCDSPGVNPFVRPLGDKIKPLVSPASEIHVPRPVKEHRASDEY